MKQKPNKVTVTYSYVKEKNKWGEDETVRSIKVSEKKAAGNRQGEDKKPSNCVTKSEKA